MTDIVVKTGSGEVLGTFETDEGETAGAICLTLADEKHFLRREGDKKIFRGAKPVPAGTYTIQARRIVSHLLPTSSEGLLRFKSDTAEILKHVKSVHTEPDSDKIYIQRTQALTSLETELACIGRNLETLKKMAMQKTNYQTVEFATISGAGKSRFVLRELGKPTFHDIPMSLVTLNFNGGTGGGSDTPLIKSSTAAKAMSRLLLSRGLFSTSPDLSFVTQQPLPDDEIGATVNTVIDALFMDRFKVPTAAGQGLLVVHLDELWLLKEVVGDEWIRDFITILLDYSYAHSPEGRYILPVVTHTCPDHNLLLNPEFNNSLFSPKSLSLPPLTLAQSMEILIWRRANDGDKNADRIDWNAWENVIALAGGHPGLLVECYTKLTDSSMPVEHNTQNEAAVVVDLASGERIKKFNRSLEALKGKETGPASMVSFITDCLLLNKVPFGKHGACLRVGLGWFEPESTEGILGLVSCPFPILVSLMAKCDDGKFSAIGRALNPREPGFVTTKAMEYVSALAVLLNRTKSISLWVQCPSEDAFKILEKAEEDFFAVWKLENQPVLDFGGLLSGWKILGQSKMQQAGLQTTQALAEVLDMAWKIGNKVKKEELTGQLHAYWVSSRISQSISQMKNLIPAFRVAMGGKVSKDEAIKTIRTEKERQGIKDAMVTIYDLMALLKKMDTSEDHKFTYVGRIVSGKAGAGGKQVKESDCKESIIHLSDLFPKGVFAGWG